jgi:hypothetical protein
LKGAVTASTIVIGEVIKARVLKPIAPLPRKAGAIR